MKKANDLFMALPEVFPRERVGELLSGIISPKTLANLDCEGRGPQGRIRIGRKICYQRGPFVEWLASRTSEAA